MLLNENSRIKHAFYAHQHKCNPSNKRQPGAGEIQYSGSRPRESRGAAPACVDRSLLAACPRGRTDRCFAGSKPLFPRGIACLSVEPRSMKKWGSGLISAIKPACKQAHQAIRADSDPDHCMARKKKIEGMLRGYFRPVTTEWSSNVVRP